MMRVTVALAAIAALSLGACGDDKDNGTPASGSVCDKATNVTAAFGTCQFPQGAVSGPADKAACEAVLAKCNDADKKILGDIYDCFGNVTPCVAGGEVTWGLTVGLTCGAQMSGLTPACRGAE